MASLTNDAVNAGTLLNTNFSNTFSDITDVSVNDISNNINSYYNELTGLEGAETTAELVKTLEDTIDDLEQEKEKNIKEADFYTGSTLKNINYIEAFKGIFLALLVVLLILVLQAMGIIESVTVVIVLIVITITVSIIYSISYLITGISLSDRLPNVFNYDFTKTNKIKNNESFQPYYKETNCAELKMKAE
tara:strand:- start:147 stop:719 length:573 start_codon:yes stop_codon:yes gene_type:complete